MLNKILFVLFCMTHQALFSAQMPTLTRTDQKQPATQTYTQEKNEYDRVFERVAGKYHTHKKYKLELEDIEQHALATGLVQQFRKKYYKNPTPLQISDAHTRFLDELRKHIQDFYKLSEGETSYILRKVVTNKQTLTDIDQKRIEELNSMLPLIEEEQRMIDLYHKKDTDPYYAYILKTRATKIAEEFLQKHLFEYYETCLSSSPEQIKTKKIKMLDMYLPLDLPEIERIYIGLAISLSLDEKYSPSSLYCITENGNCHLYSQKTNTVLATKMVANG